MPIYRLNSKIRLTMLCLSGFELYYRWVPLSFSGSCYSRTGLKSVSLGGSRIAAQRTLGAHEP